MWLSLLKWKVVHCGWHCSGMELERRLYGDASFPVEIAKVTVCPI